jgi:hypothetical protein
VRGRLKERWAYYAMLLVVGFVLHVVARIAVPGYRFRTDRLDTRKVAALGLVGIVLLGVLVGMLTEPEVSGKVSYLVMFAILGGLGWLLFRKLWREPEDEEP